MCIKARGMKALLKWESSSFGGGKSPKRSKTITNGLDTIITGAQKLEGYDYCYMGLPEVHAVRMSHITPQLQ